MSVTAVTIELSEGAVDPCSRVSFHSTEPRCSSSSRCGMAAMFVLTTTNLGRLSGILPKWFIVMGFAWPRTRSHGLVQSWLVFVFPAWILVFCAILLDRARKISPDLVVSDPGELERRRAA